MKMLFSFLYLMDLLITTSCAEASMSMDGKVELHTPVGKDGEGEYTASTKGCFDVINAAKHLILKSLNEMSLPLVGERPLVVADYGTADAGTSLGLMNEIVKTARSLAGSDDLEISLQ